MATEPFRPTELKRVLVNIVGMAISGLILGLLISECRQIRDTHDEVIKLETKVDALK